MSAGTEDPIINMQIRTTQGSEWDRECRIADAAFGWCLSKARANREAGRYDRAMGWLSVAAWSAGGCAFSGRMASVEMDLELARCAEGLDSGQSSERGSGRRRWLHVFDEAYVVGGHTALCWRWVEVRAAKERHSAVLMRQRGKPPEKLGLAVEASGGKVHLLDPGMGLMEQAAALASIAWAEADVVVLHTHPDSVAPAVAFGRPGGPPVVVVNHADHLFQATGAIADLVFDIRESGAEWTRECRDIQATTTVPVPLLDPQENGRVLSGAEVKSFREKLGLPSESVMLLTVGSGFKYNPMPGLSFHSAVEPVLLKNPSAWLVAIGPEDDGEWLRLRKATGGRVLALGRQENLVPYHASADIYLEGFPMGSLTAMLEAGLAGLPCVRAPREVPPPFCSDGIAFAAVPQPSSIGDYGDRIVALIRDPGLRKLAGRELQESVRRHHCGRGWIAHLEAGIARVPEIHRVNTGRKGRNVSLIQRDFWRALSHVALARPGAEDIGAAVLAEAMARKLDVEPQDYAGLGKMLEASIEAMTPPALGAVGQASGGSNRARIAVKIERRMRQGLWRRRILRVWEFSKARVFQPLGVTGIVRRFGRLILGDLRH